MGLKSGGLRGSLRNIGTGVSAIPDSEANQKLIHRWYLSEDSPPFVDQFGSADSTSVTGTTQVTGDWVDGAARQGDATDDVIETTTLGSFGSSMDTNFAVAFSTTSATANAIISAINSGGNGNQALNIATNDSFQGSTGTLTFAIRPDGTEGGDFDCIEGSTDLTTGGPYRVVCNKTGNTAADLEIWVNQVNDTATINQDLGGTGYVDFDVNIPFFARNASGTIDQHFGGVIDDICFFGDSLTQSEIESYSNPWQ